MISDRSIGASSIGCSRATVLAMRNAWRRAGAPMKKARGFAKRPWHTPTSRVRATRVSRLERARPNDYSELLMEDKHQWPLYEVFIRPRGGLDHKHSGSLHAADARMALEHAR